MRFGSSLFCSCKMTLYAAGARFNGLRSESERPYYASWCTEMGTGCSCLGTTHRVL